MLRSSVRLNSQKSLVGRATELHIVWFGRLTLAASFIEWLSAADSIRNKNNKLAVSRGSLGRAWLDEVTKFPDDACGVRKAKADPIWESFRALGPLHHSQRRTGDSFVDGGIRQCGVAHILTHRRNLADQSLNMAEL